MNVRTTVRTTAPSTARHRLPPTVRLRLQHRMCLTRAYRLGKSETYWIFLCLLHEQRYSPTDLRRQIMGQLDYLEVAGPEALEVAENGWCYEEFLGRADACRACLRWIDFDWLEDAALARQIARAMVAAWPRDYREYCRRQAAWHARFRIPGTPHRRLPLRDWYTIVDSLHAEIYRSRRAGLPPSEKQQALANLLLCRPGEPIPCPD